MAASIACIIFLFNELPVFRVDVFLACTKYVNMYSERFMMDALRGILVISLHQLHLHSSGEVTRGNAKPDGRLP